MAERLERQPNGKADKNDVDKMKFDWVRRRSACSLAGVFKTLRLEVEEDVKARNGLRPPTAPYEFSLADTDDGFNVILEAKQVRQSVNFKLAEHAIVVRNGKDEPMFEVILAFSDDGDCILRVNHEDRKSWQVRRMALEQLMFASY